MGRRRRRMTPFIPDEVRDAEAIVLFYEKRLDEAYDKLGQAIETAKNDPSLAGKRTAGA